MSLEAALAENTAALKEVAGLLKASNAGREAALAKLAGKDTADSSDAPKTTRKKKDEPAAGNTAAAAPPKVPTKDDLRKVAEQFMDVNVVPKGTPERSARVQFIKSLIEHFGANPDDPGLVGAVPDEHVPFVVEAIGIKSANMATPVSFPAVEPPAAEEEDEDDLGI